jgi:hypothetical protein
MPSQPKPNTMIIVITQLKLKSPFAFFGLANQARKILGQLKKHPHTGFKKTGFWTDHYTMTSWNNREEMRAFATTGAHLEAMKMSGKIAKEIRTFTYETNAMPAWKEAKAMLAKDGRVTKY